MRRKARSQPKNRTKKVSARTARAARQPVPERQRTVKARAVVPVAAASSDTSSLLFPLVLGAALGLSLLVVVLALTPVWALPRPMQAPVYDRRGELIMVGCTAALSIGLGFAITLVAP